MSYNFKYFYHENPRPQIGGFYFTCYYFFSYFYKMLRFGNISEVNANTGYARVKFLDDGIVSDWLQIVVKSALNDKQSFTFDVNEQVACLMDEHSEEGVILGALYNDSNKPSGTAGVYKMSFSDDSFVEYDKNTHKLTVNIAGDIDVVSSGTVSVDATTIGMTGIVNVTGSMTVSGAITAASISAGGMSADGGDLSVTGEVSASSVIAGTIDLATHVHAGVQSGSSSTAPPTP